MRKFAAMMLVVLAIAATPAMSQPASDADALARNVAALVEPPAHDEMRAGILAQSLEPISRLAVSFSQGALSFDERQLRTSLTAGSLFALKARREALAQVIQAQMSTQHQQEVIAFYQSRDGRAAMRSFVQFQRRSARWLERSLRALGEERSTMLQSPPEYTPTLAEAAFNATPAGEALRQALETPLPEELVRSAGATAEADYCAELVCTDAQREYFASIFSILAPDRTPPEHRMWSNTAADLFANENDQALVRAACDGDAQGVAEAVARGANPNVIGGEGGMNTSGHRIMVTPLAWAIDCNSVAGVEALLNAGANPNLVEPLTSTPVILAASEYNPELLRMLLARGGDPNAQTRERTALETALSTGNWLTRVENQPPEQAYASWNALIAAGADPNRVAPEGRPLMQVAAYDDNWRIVEWLLDHGWDGDWVELGRNLEFSEASERVTEAEQSALARVRARITAHGVRFPIGALNNLQRDSRGFYIQPPQE